MSTSSELAMLIRVKDEASAALNRLRGTLGDTSNSFSSMAATATATFAGFVAGEIVIAGISAAFRAVTGAIGDSITNASNLNETLNKSAVVFGSANGMIQEFTKNSVSALGMSQNTATDATASFGNLLTSLGMTREEAAKMSIQAVKLAADLGSFHNVGTEETLQRMKSGLIGEIEPMRRLGVAITEQNTKDKAYAMGLATVGSELTELNKIQARWALTLQMSADAQGDFARTSTGLANAQKILSAAFEQVSGNIGTMLLPILGPATSQLASMAMKIGEATGSIAGYVTKYAPAIQAAANQAFKPLIDGINSVIGKTAELATEDSFIQWSARVMAGLRIAVYAIQQAVPLIVGYFINLANKLAPVMGAIYKMIQIALNPFMRQSPSLVENVESGYARIMAGIRQVSQIAGPMGTARAAMLSFAAAAGSGMATFEATTRAAQLKTLSVFGSEVPAAFAEATDAIYATEAALFALDQRIAAQAAVVQGFNDRIAAIDDQMYELRNRMEDSADAFDAGGSGDVGGGLASQANQMKPFQDAVDASQRRLSDLQDAMNAAKAEFDRFMGTNLTGTKAFDDAMFALNQEIKRGELNLLNLKMSGAPQKDIEAAEAALQTLRDNAQKKQYQFELETDPLKRQIEQLANPVKELSFAEIIAGLTGAQAKMNALEPTLTAEGVNLKILQGILDEHRGALDSVGGAVRRVNDEYKELAKQMRELERQKRELDKEKKPEEKGLTDLEKERTAIAQLLADWRGVLNEVLSQAKQFETALDKASKINPLAAMPDIKETTAGIEAATTEMMEAWTKTYEAAYAEMKIPVDEFFKGMKDQIGEIDRMFLGLRLPDWLQKMLGIKSEAPINQDEIPWGSSSVPGGLKSGPFTPWATTPQKDKPGTGPDIWTGDPFSLNSFDPLSAAGEGIGAWLDGWGDTWNLLFPQDLDKKAEKPKADVTKMFTDMETAQADYGVKLDAMNIAQYQSTTTAATETYNKLVGQSIIPDTVNGMLEWWEHLLIGTTAYWNAMGSMITAVANQMIVKLNAVAQAYNTLAIALNSAKIPGLDAMNLPTIATANGAGSWGWNSYPPVGLNPPPLTPAKGAPPQISVTVNVAGSVTTQNDLVAAVRAGIQRTNQRNGDLVMA